MKETKIPVEAPIAESAIVEAKVFSTEFEEVINDLLKNGAKMLAPNRITDVQIEGEEIIDEFGDVQVDYRTVSFALANKVPALLRQSDGSYKEGLRNTISSSKFEIFRTIRENENLAWLCNSFIKNNKLLNLILNGAEVKIIQQHIPANTPYVNLLTVDESTKPRVYDRDFIVNHIIDFKLSKAGERMADKLVDKLLGL